MSGEQLEVACERTHETAAPPCTNGDSARTASAAPISPEKDQNAQTEHLGMARSSRGVFPNGCLQGFSDAWRAYLAKTSSFRMHGGDMLPGRGAFPVRGTFWDT